MSSSPSSNTFIRPSSLSCKPSTSTSSTNCSSNSQTASLRHYTVNALEHTVSASAGAMLQIMLTNPFDVVKTRMQIQSSISGSAQNALISKTPFQYKNSLDAFLTISKEEGVRGLWRGFLPAIVMQIPSTGLYYAAYEAFKQQYEKSLSPSQHAYIPFLSGISARLIAAAISTPLEYMRTMIQSHTAPPAQLIKQFLSQRPQQMFTGMDITLLRDVPFSAIYWLCYENLKKDMQQRYPGEEYVCLNSFVSGALSGMISAAVTNPLDVIKTRVQSNYVSKDSIGARPSIVETAKDMWRQEHFKGLFRGIVPRVMKVAPSCAIMISTYEQCKQIFQQYHERQQEKSAASQKLAFSPSEVVEKR